MKIIFFILIFSPLSLSAVSRQDSVLKVTLIQTLYGDIKDFSTDNLGNIYLLTATNQIKKVNEKGDSVAVYNDVRRYGKISAVDATNPLKILVYYKDFSTIVVLDRLLNAQAVVDLRKQNILQVTAVTSSYDNNIWVYDELDSKIKKISDNGAVLLESTDFRQVFDSVPSPSAMYDRDGLLYLYDQRKGLMVFDYYGGIKNKYQLLHLSDLQVIDKNTITARDNKSIVLYKPATFQTFNYKVFLHQEDFIKLNFNGRKLYVLTGAGALEIYSVLEK